MSPSGWKRSLRSGGTLTRVATGSPAPGPSKLVAGPPIGSTLVAPGPLRSTVVPSARAKRRPAPGAPSSRPGSTRVPPGSTTPGSRLSVLIGGLPGWLVRVQVDDRDVVGGAGCERPVEQRLGEDPVLRGRTDRTPEQRLGHAGGKPVAAYEELEPAFSLVARHVRCDGRPRTAAEHLRQRVARALVGDEVGALRGVIGRELDRLAVDQLVDPRVA